MKKRPEGCKNSGHRFYLSDAVVSCSVLVHINMKVTGHKFCAYQPSETVFVL